MNNIYARPLSIFPLTRAPDPNRYSKQFEARFVKRVRPSIGSALKLFARDALVRSKIARILFAGNSLARRVIVFPPRFFR